MKRLLGLSRVVPVLLLATLAVPVTVAAPAHAKGATDVVVSGPGIHDVRLGWTRRKDDVDAGSLAELSGIYQIYGAAIATDDPGLTRAELGPRYRLTWYQGTTVMVVSHVYPFTTQSAWHRIPHEDGGWIRGGPGLEQAMVRLGATPPRAGSAGSADSGHAASSAADDTTDPPAAAAVTSPEDPTSGTSPVTPAAVGTVVVLLIAAGVWLARRRRTVQPA